MPGFLHWTAATAKYQKRVVKEPNSLDVISYEDVDTHIAALFLCLCQS